MKIRWTIFKLFFYSLKIENEYDKENKLFKTENGYNKENKLKIYLRWKENAKKLFKENVSRSMFNGDCTVLIYF
jgi:hypothetical protein